jgi:hypothetical protein
VTRPPASPAVSTATRTIGIDGGDGGAAKDMEPFN